MSNIFGNATTEGVEEAQDRLGGFRVHDTDAYNVTILAAYVGQSTRSQARSVTLIVEAPELGGEYRETIWVTNGKGENVYQDKNDPSKKHFQPGWTTIDDICLATCNKGLKDMVAQDKVVNVYDLDAKAEVPKSVPMLVELLNKKVTLGIVKSTVNKQKKDGNGGYVDTDETREENSIEKVFHFPSNSTIAEAKKQVQGAPFYKAWVEKNRGKTRDRTNKNAGGQTGNPGMPPRAGNSAPNTPSLFG